MKVLISTSFVLEIADWDEAAKLVAATERAARDNFLSVLERHGATVAEAEELFEYFGVTCSPLTSFSVNGRG